MTRLVLSLLGLLVVLWIVMKLAGTQLAALTPAAPAAGAASAPAPARAAQDAAARVQRAIEQGAAQRAEDAASR
jgi:hypothetical protein